MSFQWPQRLQLATRPTPLQPLARLSKTLGGPRIWIKRDDLTGNMLSGNKVRKLEFILAEAIDKGCDSIVTCGGIQSNHCRATAFAGAQLGLKVHLVLRGEPMALDGNSLLDKLAGADITYHPQAHFSEKLDDYLQSAADQLKADGYHKPCIIPTGGSNGTGVWGYFSAAEELKRDCERLGLSPRFITSATGSGGTQAGLSLGCAYFDMPASVLSFAVCDSEAWFQQKVTADIDDFYERYEHRLSAKPEVSIHTNDAYIGEGYAKAGPEVLATIHRVAREEGILLDPVYTGKAFHGLINEISAGTLGKEGDIIFVHTGGSFGVFPFRDAFNQVVT